jgi:hypothetical protein
MKANNLPRCSTYATWYKVSSSKLLILFARRPTNVLYCPNSEGTPSNTSTQAKQNHGLPIFGSPWFC